jgi:hypothetical protein
MQHAKHLEMPVVLKSKSEGTQPIAGILVPHGNAKLKHARKSHLWPESRRSKDFLSKPEWRDTNTPSRPSA